jgi:hypothetical protein
VAVVGGGGLGLGHGGLWLGVPLASPPYKGEQAPRAGRPPLVQVGEGSWVPTRTPPLLPNLEHIPMKYQFSDWLVLG